MSVLGKAAAGMTAAALGKILAGTVVLLVLLLASAALNVRQWADHRTERARWHDQVQLAAMEAATKTAGRLATERDRDSAQLLKDLDAIAERGQRTRVVYRQAAAATPLPEQCAPGQARMDAVNAGADP